MVLHARSTSTLHDVACMVHRHVSCIAYGQSVSVYVEDMQLMCGQDDTLVLPMQSVVFVMPS